MASATWIEPTPLDVPDVPGVAWTSKARNESASYVFSDWWHLSPRPALALRQREVRQTSFSAVLPVALGWPHTYATLWRAWRGVPTGGTVWRVRC